MKKTFQEAHKLAKGIVKKYGVDYQTQFSLCLSYLLENKGENQMGMFEWKLKDGSDFKIEFAEEPVIRKAEPFEGWMEITNAWVNGEEVEKDKEDKLWRMSPIYKYNEDEKVLAVEVKYQACKDILKKLGLKKKLDEVYIAVSDEFKTFYEKEFAPKIETGISKVKQDIKDGFENSYKALKDTDIIKFFKNTSFGYHFNGSYDESKFFLEVQKIFSDSKIKLDKYETDTDWGDYTVTTYYEMTFAELKEQVEEAKKLIEQKKQEIKEKEDAEKARVEELFQKAKETREKQIIKSWSEPCNDPKEECDIDSIVIWAMPDGTTETTRSHTW